MSFSSTPPLLGGSRTFSVATWNIRSARGSGLAAAARGLRQMGVGCCVLTETKLTDDQYLKTTSGYRVILSKATSPHQGGVVLLWVGVTMIKPTTSNLFFFIFFATTGFVVLLSVAFKNNFLGVFPRFQKNPEIEVSWESCAKPAEMPIM